MNSGLTSHQHLVHTSISFHKKLASFCKGFYQNHDLDRHVYEHLAMASLINWKAWSANRNDLCIEMFPHLMTLQDH